MLYNPWAYKVDTTKQPCHRCVYGCTYWPVLCSCNSYNIIQFTNKATSSEDFDSAHKVVLDGISDNMASLVQLGKYGNINAADTTTMGYHVIKYLSEPYTL